MPAGTSSRRSSSTTGTTSPHATSPPPSTTWACSPATEQRSTSRMARIALYGAGGAPFHHAAVYARAGHDVDFVFPQDILDGALAGFDAFVMPGGGYRAMFGQIEPLGPDGAR